MNYQIALEVVVCDIWPQKIHN